MKFHKFYTKMNLSLTNKPACLLLLLCTHAIAQHPWQKPNPPVPKAEIDRIIGPVTTTKTERPIHALWVWGYDKNHGPGNHDYERIRDLMTGLLGKIPGFDLETVYEFPTAEQFAKSDLVCMYLHLPDLSDQQHADLKGFINRGGAVVSIHETCIIRPQEAGQKLSESLGMAWNEGESKWGALFTGMTLDTDHEIFRGFGKKLEIPDEFYWNLNTQKEGVRIIASVPTGPPDDSHSPIAEDKLDQTPWPVVWTYELGKGRVFGTSAGHNTFTFYDPKFRIMLFRGLAWTLRQKPDPFMPAIYEGITSPEGMVGTTETMRDWRGKRRGPK